MNPYLKFNPKEKTLGIKLHYIGIDMPLEEYEKVLMRKGWFCIGYNYVLHPDGSLEKGVPETDCCDPFIDGWNDHVCVLVMGVADGETTALQDSALKNLAKKLNLTITR